MSGFSGAKASAFASNGPRQQFHVTSRMPGVRRPKAWSLADADRMFPRDNRSPQGPHSIEQTRSYRELALEDRNSDCGFSGIATRPVPISRSIASRSTRRAPRSETLCR